MTRHFEFITDLEVDLEVAARLVDSPAAVAYLMSPLLCLDPLDGTPGERFRAGPQRFRVRALGLIPVGTQTIDVSWPEGAEHVLLDVGGNAFTQRYAHRIELHVVGRGRIRCVDRTEIDAGILTAPVTLGFWLVNRIVQLRWPRLLRLLD